MRNEQRMREEKPLLITVKDACGLTGLSEKTVRNLIYENALEVRVGRRVMINRKRLEKWIESNIR